MNKLNSNNKKSFIDKYSHLEKPIITGFGSGMLIGSSIAIHVGRTWWIGGLIGAVLLVALFICIFWDAENI